MQGALRRQAGSGSAMGRCRQGATLVIVAILTVVLFAFTAFAIDLGQAYLSRAQLQTTADAAALAAVVEIRERTPDLAPTRALQNAAHNLVQTELADVELADVIPGQWRDDTEPKFVPKANWTDANVNAAQVTTRYTMPYSFARVLGFDEIPLTTRAIAAVGYVQGVSCVKPWAISYQAMLNTLYDAYGEPVPDITYDLTDEDILTLSTGEPSPPPITLLLDENSQVSGGNISKVQTWEGGTGNNEYKNAITDDCYSEKQIFPGDWLPTITGAGSGTSTQAVQQLCGVQGGGNNAVFDCDEVIRAVIYDIHTDVNGSNLEFRVKYIGVFKIIQYDKGTGGGGTPIPQVTGEFVALEMPGGEFSMKPSPIFGPIALVR